MPGLEETWGSGGAAAAAASDENDDTQKKGSRGGGKPKWRQYRLTVLYGLITFGLVASGLVPRGDLLFAAFASLYVYIMSRVVTPPAVSTASSTMLSRSWIIVYYMLFTAVVGMILPLVLLLISLCGRGDQASARDAAPHMFLLLAQVISENLTMPRASLSLPVRALVPIMYNARRLLTLWTWVVAVWNRDVNGQSSGSMTWLISERAVAVANVLTWNFNLWAFLLPVYLPWTFRNYYAGEKTVRGRQPNNSEHG